MENYKIVIIGGGPAGYAAAVKASQLGVKTALIEKTKLGGVCLHQGCIPTKALCSFADRKIPFTEAIKEKEAAVKNLEKQVEYLVSSNKIALYRGTANITSLNEISIKTREGAEVISAEKIIIATGSSPAIPDNLKNSDREKILTSDEVVNLYSLPKKILIIGGGYIGCEFATIFSSYGVDVEIVESFSKLLPMEDDDVVDEVSVHFKKAGIKIHTSTKVEYVETKTSVKAALSDGSIVECDLVLVAIGRSPNSNGIGLEKIGIQMSSKGIKINERMETNIRGVYAVGDVADKELKLAHVAEGEGIVAVENALNDIVKKASIVDYRHVPRAIFTKPEIAAVGLTELKLKEKGIKYTTGKWQFKWNGKAQAEGDTEGFAKVMISSDLKILGAYIVGRNASELIGRVVDAINDKCNGHELMKYLSNPIYCFHPSRNEAVKDAVNEALKKIHKGKLE